MVASTHSSSTPTTKGQCSEKKHREDSCSSLTLTFVRLWPGKSRGINFPLIAYCFYHYCYSHRFSKALERHKEQALTLKTKQLYVDEKRNTPAARSRGEGRGEGRGGRSYHTSIVGGSSSFLVTILKFLYIYLADRGGRGPGRGGGDRRSAPNGAPGSSSDIRPPPRRSV